MVMFVFVFVDVAVNRGMSLSGFRARQTMTIGMVMAVSLSLTVALTAAGGMSFSFDRIAVQLLSVCTGTFSLAISGREAQESIMILVFVAADWEIRVATLYLSLNVENRHRNRKMGENTYHEHESL